MKATKTLIFYHDQKLLIDEEEGLIAKVHGKNATIIFKK